MMNTIHRTNYSFTPTYSKSINFLNFIFLLFSEQYLGITYSTSATRWSPIYNWQGNGWPTHYYVTRKFILHCPNWKFLYQPFDTYFFQWCLIIFIEFSIKIIISIWQYFQERVISNINITRGWMTRTHQTIYICQYMLYQYMLHCTNSYANPFFRNVRGRNELV